MLENLGMCFKSEFVFFRVLVEDELDFNFVEDELCSFGF